MQRISRREFFNGVGALATSASFSNRIQWLAGAPEAYRASGASAAIRVAYAAITWGSDGRKAITDISEVGFHEIQLRADAIKQFQPTELKEALRDRSVNSEG